MIICLAAALLAAEPAVGLGDAVQALQAGRLEQARLVLDTAVNAGASGEEVDRLRAELAFRSGHWAAARQGYERLAAQHPGESLTLERAGIAAFQLGEYSRSAAALKAATALPGATWRAWNARGAVADKRRDWDDADQAYAKALELGPERAETLNNYGWSLLLRGRWVEALEQLERAGRIDPKSKRIANNLELARAALANDLPKRASGETEAEWAARLNDAGVLAAASGDRRRAIAAFAQAIEASSKWFARAANNMALVEGE